MIDFISRQGYAAPSADRLPWETRMPSILIVDDEHDVLTAFAAVLRHAGHRVRTASTPDMALQLLDTLQPDLVLLDIKLGNLDQTDGLDLLQQMRARRPQLKVVIVSGYLDLLTRRAALDAGALDCWPKPITIQAIRDRTAEVLGQADRSSGPPHPENARPN
jgi:DNA-binding NtrC family response regulator